MSALLFGHFFSGFQCTVCSTTSKNTKVENNIIDFWHDKNRFGPNPKRAERLHDWQVKQKKPKVKKIGYRERDNEMTQKH